MNYTLSFLTGLICLLFISVSFSQNTENSPMSRYGLGDLRNMSTGWMSGMANAGTAYISEQFYNPLNPASAAFIKQTDVELGIYAKYDKQKDDRNLTSSGWSGSLNNIFVAIPLRNSINELLDRKKYNHSFSLQFGLAPYSLVGYKSQLNDTVRTRENQDTLAVNRFLQGDGLINAFQLGLSYHYKDLAIGLQMNYLFGNLNYYQNLLYTSIPASYDSYLTDKYHISGWRPTIGILYKKIINQKEIDKDETQRKNILSIGLTINLPSTYTSSHSALHLTRYEEKISVVDTVLYLNEYEQSGKLPFGIKAGVYYSKKEKLGLMASYSYDAWQNATLTQEALGSTSASDRIQIGGWVKPGLSSYDKFLTKSIYRFGAYVGNDYRNINGQQASLYGFTFGWGYPILFLRQDAMVHLNFEFGHRKLENQLTDNFFLIHFGISINDNEWFLKRRYN